MSDSICGFNKEPLQEMFETRWVCLSFTLIIFLWKKSVMPIGLLCKHNAFEDKYFEFLVKNYILFSICLLRT